MSIGGVTNRSSLLVQSVMDTRAQLDDLQRQLGTGQKSTTYAGLGANRGLSVSLRNQLNLMNGYSDAITNVNVRINLASTALTGISKVASTVKGAAESSTFTIDSSGQTQTQRSAVAQFDQVLSLLNTQSGDRYLFSGRATDQPSTDTLDHILNGDATHAGFKTVMAQRAQADLGANGLGRLVIPAAVGSQISVSEDAAGSPFGFKLAGVSSLNGATVTQPTGSPPSITVNLTSNPNPGDTVTFTFNLPDGTKSDLTLTATASSPPGAGQFTVGATPADTANNLQGALTTGVSALASTSLTAASAMCAAHDFFDGQPPMRVAGPPYNTATAQVAGTPDNTITWYTGETGTDSARNTAVAQVDNSLTVSYGARANEQALTDTLKSMAVYASMTYSASDPNAAARYAEVNQRVSAGLASTNGQQQISDIQSELAFAQSTMANAKTSQQQRSATLTDLLQGVEQADPDQLASQILALQTQLQASLQTTASLYRLSIVNYITN